MLGGIGDPHHRALTMNTFLAKPVIGRQFYFDGDDLAHRWDRKLRVDTAPGNEYAATANVFSVHGAFHPKRRRRNMAPELDFDPQALASINSFHFFYFDTAEFSSVGEAHQCRKWAITLCCRRIAMKYNRGQHHRKRRLPLAKCGRDGLFWGLQIYPRKIMAGYYRLITAELTKASHSE